MVLKGLMYTGLYSSSVCSSRLHYLPSRLLWSNWLYYKAGDFYTLPLRVGVHVHLWWWSFHNHSWRNICNFNLHYRLVAFDSLLLLAATSTPCDTHTHFVKLYTQGRKERGGIESITNLVCLLKYQTFPAISSQHWLKPICIT